MKIYEIVVKSQIDEGFFKTFLALSSIPLTEKSEAVKTISKIDDEWGEYIASVREKKIIICYENDEELSEMSKTLYSLGQ